jgi:hypothetical protein
MLSFSPETTNPEILIAVEIAGHGNGLPSEALGKALVAEGLLHE